MRKIEREYAVLCSSIGVDIERIEHRNGHYALHFDFGVVFAAGTPSDRRNLKNVKANILRLRGR